MAYYTGRSYLCPHDNGMFLSCSLYVDEPIYPNAMILSRLFDISTHSYEPHNWECIGRCLKALQPSDNVMFSPPMNAALEHLRWCVSAVEQLRSDRETVHLLDDTSQIARAAYNKLLMLYYTRKYVHHGESTKKTYNFEELGMTLACMDLGRSAYQRCSEYFNLKWLWELDLNHKPEIGVIQARNDPLRYDCEEEFDQDVDAIVPEALEWLPTRFV